MEVESHCRRAVIWEEMFDLAFQVFHQWLSEDLLDKADHVAEQLHAEGDPEEEQWRERLEAEHLTKAQRRYSYRCYPKAPSSAERPLPWPAPERLDEDTIRMLASTVREKPPSSGKAQAALRLLSVAAVIEAARRSDVAGISEN